MDSASDNSDAEASNRFMRFGMRKSKRKKKVKEKVMCAAPYSHTDHCCCRLLMTTHVPKRISLSGL